MKTTETGTKDLAIPLKMVIENPPSEDLVADRSSCDTNVHFAVDPDKYLVI